MPIDIPPLPPIPTGPDQVDQEQVQESLGFVESSGDHRAYNDSSYGPENPALGKYQTLKTTAWEVLQRHGKPVPASINEYLNSPDTQEEVMDLLMGEYIEAATNDTPENTPNRYKTILKKIAAQHYGGPGNMNLYDDKTPQEGGYPSFYDYGEKFIVDYMSGRY
tara:strand:- start:4615 stop:5106 length:492 start_codon:yes stop_codon:yes gene_type:complete